MTNHIQTNEPSSIWNLQNSDEGLTFCVFLKAAVQRIVARNEVMIAALMLQRLPIVT